MVAYQAMNMKTCTLLLLVLVGYPLGSDAAPSYGRANKNRICKSCGRKLYNFQLKDGDSRHVDVSCSFPLDYTFWTIVHTDCDKRQECQCRAYVLAYDRHQICHCQRRLDAGSTTSSIAFVPATTPTATERIAGGEDNVTPAPWEVAAIVGVLVSVIPSIIVIFVVIFLRYRRSNKPREALAANSALSQGSEHVCGAKDDDAVPVNDKDLAQPESDTNVFCHLRIVEEAGRGDKHLELSARDNLLPTAPPDDPQRELATTADPTRHGDDTDDYDRLNHHCNHDKTSASASAGEKDYQHLHRPGEAHLVKAASIGGYELEKIVTNSNNNAAKDATRSLPALGATEKGDADVSASAAGRQAGDDGGELECLREPTLDACSLKHEERHLCFELEASRNLSLEKQQEHDDREEEKEDEDDIDDDSDDDYKTDDDDAADYIRLYRPAIRGRVTASSEDNYQNPQDVRSTEVHTPADHGAALKL